MNTEKTIEAARKGFEESFEEGKFYNRQTQDTEFQTKRAASAWKNGNKSLFFIENFRQGQDK